MNPMQALMKSRKFWLLILDTLVSLIVFFTGKYWATGVEDVNFVIGALQPVFVMLIYSIAHEDAAEKSAGVITISAPDTTEQTQTG